MNPCRGDFDGLLDLLLELSSEGSVFMAFIGVECGVTVILLCLLTGLGEDAVEKVMAGVDLFI